MYYPLAYVEPWDQTALRISGIDIGAEPTRRKALDVPAGQALDGGDGLVGDGLDGAGAGEDAFSIDQDGARPALALGAADLRAGEAEVFAEDLHEGAIGVGGQGVGVSGDVKMPAELAPAMKLLDRVNVRMDKVTARFKELAESRTGDERVRAQLMEVLERWFVLGRDGATSFQYVDASVLLKHEYMLIITNNKKG